jgi:spermidine synthase
VLELRRRGDRDFMILHDGRVLMTSMLTRSEKVLAELAIAPLEGAARPRLLIGGLGLGFTVRAALDRLEQTARVVVAELNPIVIEWCRGPAAAAAGQVLSDPRVEVVAADVAEELREAARPGAEKFDGIAIDLYFGPGDDPREERHPLYGLEALRTTQQALKPGGRFVVWGEGRSRVFEARLQRAGLRSEFVRSGPRGAVQHSLYIGTRGP